MLNRSHFYLATTLLLSLSLTALSQQKLLTIDDIFDPVKRVNFNGTTPTVRWLKDGNHYLLVNDASRRDVPRLQKVNAATGEAMPFFDAAKMQAAFAALPGITCRERAPTRQSRQLQSQSRPNCCSDQLVQRSLLLRVWQRPCDPADKQS